MRRRDALQRGERHGRSECQRGQRHAHHLRHPGGQRQRVAIARATVTEPKVLLADEPTGNLDHKSGDDVINVLESLNSKGITLLVVTHDHELGERAQRQLKMRDGCIVSNQFNATGHASL